MKIVIIELVIALLRPLYNKSIEKMRESAVATYIKTATKQPQKEPLK